MLFQVIRKLARKVLINQHLHRELVSSPLASSSAAIASALLTEGKFIQKLIQRIAGFQVIDERLGFQQSA